jgi:hypothetical protein
MSGRSNAYEETCKSIVDSWKHEMFWRRRQNKGFWVYPQRQQPEVIKENKLRKMEV